MKRPLSLLEVSIGLTLTAILLTTLFSSFHQLMKTGVRIETVRSEMHTKHLMQLRLNQIFESVSDGKLFYTDAHGKAHGEALYFTFNNGVDQDPAFCGEIDAVLFASKEKKPKISLLLKDQRLENFADDITDFSFAFFDPEQKKWLPTWNKKVLPPMLAISLDQITYTFNLPKANQKVIYK